MRLANLLLSSGLAFAVVSGKVHHLFVGNLTPPNSIYALEFDDKALTLTVVKNNTAASAHGWLAFDHNKKNIYGSSTSSPRISSYSVVNSSTLELNTVIETQTDCRQGNDTSAFVLALKRHPYTTFSSSWPGQPACGITLTTHHNGTLKEIEDLYHYAPESGIHGLALGRKEKYLYASDLYGQAIWTHGVGHDGSLTYLGRLDTSAEGSHPRHVAAHPRGKFIYTVFEQSNGIASYHVDRKTGIPGKVQAVYSLLPEGPLRRILNSFVTEHM